MIHTVQNTDISHSNTDITLIKTSLQSAYLSNANITIEFSHLSLKDQPLFITDTVIPADTVFPNTG